MKILTATAVVLSACGSDGGRGDGPGASGIASVGDGTAGEGTSGGTVDAADGTSDGQKFDVPSGGGTADDGLIPEEGCQAVDFLFVIDNSVSMEGEQAALVGAFPAFIDTIQATLEADSDYHIMVVDTDEWGRCNTANGFPGMDPTSATCNDYVESTAFEACDAELGAGVVHPAGEFASNTPCNFQGGKRYIDVGEPDISAAFSCAAQVGTAGHPSERPMDGMVAALSDGLNGPGGCNEGFLRDDALLVITFMSDDPNYEDAGTPQDWFDAVVAAKNGDPSAVVVLGLTTNPIGCGNENNENGSHWVEFIDLW
ncbi:MAG: hypothetical protein K0V04_07545, partial [Deltaproteobacteria bacterium]|nr:hypothetical protein [Deltaproteobacteria bacterium]